MSRTSLFTYWDDLIAIGLSFAILGEQRFLSTVGALGVGLSFLAVALFYIHANRKMERGKDVRAGFPPALFFFVGIYSIIWGVAAFSNRFFNLKQFDATEKLLFRTGRGRRFARRPQLQLGLLVNPNPAVLFTETAGVVFIHLPFLRGGEEVPTAKRVGTTEWGFTSRLSGDVRSAKTYEPLPPRPMRASRHDHRADRELIHEGP